MSGFCHRSSPVAVRSPTITCKIPCLQGISYGDRFALDWLRHQPFPWKPLIRASASERPRYCGYSRRHRLCRVRPETESARETPFDGGFNDPGRQKGQRDGAVYMTDAASLPLGDFLRRSHSAGNEFVEPSSPCAMAVTSLALVSARIGRLSDRCLELLRRCRSDCAGDRRGNAGGVKVARRHSPHHLDPARENCTAGCILTFAVRLQALQQRSVRSRMPVICEQSCCLLAAPTGTTIGNRPPELRTVDLRRRVRISSRVRRDI